MKYVYRKVRKQPKTSNNVRGKQGIVSIPRKYIGKRIKIILGGCENIYRIMGNKRKLHYNNI